jgi:undecaprenyl-phosphate 4-deoxy-4-formamido-L-arabinose transferase
MDTTVVSQAGDERHNTTLSVVIPVYNSAGSLSELHRRVSAAMAPIDSRYECILVEDGSKDQSWLKIQDLAQRDPRVRGLRMARNFGQHNAILAGIRAARGDTIVTLDDDLQNTPEEIAKLLHELGRGFDVVYGSPARVQHGFFREMASRVVKSALSVAMGVETARSVSAFRAFRTSLRDAFAGYHGPMVNIDVLLTWGTTKFGAVTVKHAPREAGVSGYSFWKLVSHAFNMITGFTTLPLQVGSIIGLVCAAFGVAILGVVLGRYVLQGSEVEGFTFLASLLAIFFGANMFLLGIFGEYLARMHLGAIGRPPYLISAATPVEETGVTKTRERAHA